MNKKILAIAVVFCLDLAFIVMIGGMFQQAEPMEVAVSHRSLPSGISENAKYPKAAPDTDASEDAAVDDPALTFQGIARSNTVRAAASNPLRSETRQNRGIRPKRPAFDYDERYQSAEPLRDTIILVKRNRVANGDQKDPRAVRDPNEKAAERPEKKRSIFSRAVPVVKKPYDWMKSLVSRL